MNHSYFLWIPFFVLLKNARGQLQRADGFGFIPRTPKNAKRIEQRMSAIQTIKHNMLKMGINPNKPKTGGGTGSSGMPTSNSMGTNNLKSNGMGTNNFKSNGMGTNNFKSNGMGTNNFKSNGMGTNNFKSNGMGTNNFKSNGMGSMMASNGGSTGGTMTSNGMSTNGMTSTRNVGMNKTPVPMDMSKMTVEQIEAHMDSGVTAMSMAGGPRGMTATMVGGEIIYMPSGMMGNGRSGGMMGNNGGMGMMGMNGGGGMMGYNGVGGRNRRRRNRMRVPLCQSLMECTERFIPPQCRSWRYDTVSSIMCRLCPVNKCEGGANEFFNTMYHEYHPQRLMFNMLS